MLKEIDLSVEEKAEKIDASIALSVVLLALWFIYHFTFCNTLGEVVLDSHQLLSDNRLAIEYVDIDNQKYVPISSDIRVRKEVLAPTNIGARKYTEVQSTSVVSDNKIQSVETVESSSASEIQVKTPIEKVESTTAIEDSVISNVNEIQVTTPIEERSEEKVAVEVDQPVILPEDKGIQDQTMEKSIAVPLSQDCIIIVGAYGLKANSIDMQRRLSKAGYSVFTTPYKGLTRVGIYQSCDTNKITSTLKSVRKNFANDATILGRE